MQKLLAIAVLASLVVSSTSAGFNFYKLSLIWPISRCNVIYFDCISPLPNYFTIHGLWPQFADDTPVPPYYQNSTCTTVTPTSPDNISVTLQPIQSHLSKRWPNLASYDIYLWMDEWEQHGMCSDYPNQPYDYFSAALDLARNPKYDPLKVMGIRPGAYVQVKTVLENVKRNVGAYPQIACNVDVGPSKLLQLWEIRFCFDRAMPPSRVRDCPKKLDGDCKQETDFISFPWYI
ncbi:Ribonuclease T2-like protein [Corchorus capsularis]|uniref:Ribonuclease T2-like protein n=1 Tax=Corchorus capsularis TaxID=210143 RepID=A0A1R3FWS3_COCAP|nr:Ribonuclease T2-like protein [Corchorus capsularis]